MILDTIKYLQRGTNINFQKDGSFQQAVGSGIRIFFFIKKKHIYIYSSIFCLLDFKFYARKEHIKYFDT